MELRACRIPTLALELWMTAVTSAPTSTPRMGLEKRTNSSVNQGSSSRGETASDMAVMPVIRMAKPIRMPPAPFFFSPPNMNSRMPTKASSGLKVEGLSSWIRRLSPSRPVRLRIQLVTVVPTLLPMMMPMAWCSSMMPLLTKPTTITVVALELWITAVTASPSRNPLKGFSVRRARIFCSRLPACRSRDLPIRSMP